MLAGKGFSCEVGYPITEIVMTSCDEAALFAVQCVAYIKFVREWDLRISAVPLVRD